MQASFISWQKHIWFGKMSVTCKLVLGVVTLLGIEDLLKKALESVTVLLAVGEKSLYFFSTILSKKRNNALTFLIKPLKKKEVKMLPWLMAD